VGSTEYWSTEASCGKCQPTPKPEFNPTPVSPPANPNFLPRHRLQGPRTRFRQRLLVEQVVRSQFPSLPLYLEGRPCTRPTTHRILELFELIQRQEIRRVPSPGIPSHDPTSAPENALVSTLS
jgi:hypothetical protein